MGTSELTIAHISDIHLAESLTAPPGDRVTAPHRSGHDFRAFVALDTFLRTNLDLWDVLVVSGDLSRVGHRKSFQTVHSWLHSQLNADGTTLGLELDRRTDHRCIVVPGNHDRFNTRWAQSSLEAYSQCFEPIGLGKVSTIKKDGTDFRFHLLDSSFNGGGFGAGRVDAEALVRPIATGETVDIAVFHHHIVQAPGTEPSRWTEMKNVDEVAAFLLAGGIVAALFGHTHTRYIDVLSGGAIGNMLPNARRRGQFFRRSLPRLLATRPGESPLKPRRKCRDGKYPTVESFQMYRFLQGRGRDDILGPESFKNSKAFRRYIEGSAGGVSLKDAVHEALENRIVLSMAPSACQAEEAEKGFQLLTLHVEAGRLCSVEYSHCDYRGAEFHQRPAKRLEVASGAADPSAKVFSANSGVKEND